MTVEATPLVVEKQMVTVSLSQGCDRRRSANPAHTSTTGWPCQRTARAPPPLLLGLNSWPKYDTTGANIGCAAPLTAPSGTCPFVIPPGCLAEVASAIQRLKGQRDSPARFRSVAR